MQLMAIKPAIGFIKIATLISVIGSMFIPLLLSPLDNSGLINLGGQKGQTVVAVKNEASAFSGEIFILHSTCFLV